MSIEVALGPSTMDVDIQPDSGGGGTAGQVDGEKSPARDAPGYGGTDGVGAIEGEGSPDDHEGDVNGRKKKHRRGKSKGGKRHKNQWRPYTSLSWEQRREIDERQSKRAAQRREKRLASGMPMAPYNTTQFLMEQHQSDIPTASERLHGKTAGATLIGGRSPNGPARGEGSGSQDSSEYDSSAEDRADHGENEFLENWEKEFSETYENCHAERLQSLNKAELIQEYLELEAKVERLEKGKCTENGASLRQNSNGHGRPRDDASVNVASSKVQLLQAEIEKLNESNRLLQLENKKLRTIPAPNSVSKREVENTDAKAEDVS